MKESWMSVGVRWMFMYPSEWWWDGGGHLEGLVQEGHHADREREEGQRGQHQDQQ